MSTSIIEKPAEKVDASDILATPPTELKESLPAQTGLVSDTETYSREVLGEAYFEMFRLTAIGLRGDIVPWGPAPSQSPHIVDSDETMRVGTIIRFNRSPLTALLLCLGIDICVNFHFEGLGGAAKETDFKVKVKSTEGQFVYWVGTQIKPEDLELNSGYYLVSATAEIGPVTHKCGQYVFGYGYIGERRLQVAVQPFTD